MCVDIVCVFVLVQQLSFHCKSASARDKYRHQHCDTLWYRDTKKYRHVCDTGIVQNLYRDTTIASNYRPALVKSSVLFSIPDGQKIAQFATFARPRGRTKVANWHYFPFLPTSIHQKESSNDIINYTN